MILCVAANPSIDRLFTVDQLVLGEIHRPAEFVQLAGGKGLNVARAAVELGGDAEAVALLGGHAGRWIAEELAAEGIRLHVAWAAAETRSSLSVAGALEGLTEFYEHGFPVEPDEWAGFTRLVAELAPRARWMTLSGSLPSGAPDDGYAGLAAARAGRLRQPRRRPRGGCGARQAERARGGRGDRRRDGGCGRRRSPPPTRSGSGRARRRS